MAWKLYRIHVYARVGGKGGKWKWYWMRVWRKSKPEVNCYNWFCEVHHPKEKK